MTVDPYDDRRAHLVRYGAQDTDIAGWVAFGVDIGKPAAEILAAAERILATGHTVFEVGPALRDEFRPFYGPDRTWLNFPHRD